ncbi:GNAT family N-acetyltransferase [Aspergillus affinis]|uniref:GNAT family N-acetyltransferase n=1 Tax=Aspergillus affinis TaxID=1070780 RepID=UPI0022FE90AE|nr:uncharacterized protein KD926_002371 [Aspergillus affinis]KAI9043992.1 hypothetical protein KD926_002371 [Aspergillus affinis]
MSFPPPFQTARLSFVPMNADQHADAVFEIRGRDDVMKYSINHAPDPSVETTHAWLSRFNHFDDRSRPDISTSINADISPIGYVIHERLSSTDTNLPPSSEKQGEGKIIGTTGLRLGVSPLTPQSQSVQEKRWEIGYGFHPSTWGRGIASEAVRGFIRVVGEEGLLGFPIGPTSSNDGTDPETGSDSVNASEEAKVKVKPVLAACTDALNEASRRVLEKAGFVLTGEFVDGEGRGNFEFEYRF